MRNGSLQGGYFITAARSLGLDCGPMSGFDAAKVNAEFFPDGKWRANFVCNLGHGDKSKLFPRNPPLQFEEAWRILLSSLFQKFSNYLAVVDGGAFVAAVVAIGQAQVVQAHEVHDGRVEVVDMNALVHGPQADLIRCAEGQSGLNASARHPDRKAPGIVVTALGAFRHGCPAELP